MFVRLLVILMSVGGTAFVSSGQQVDVRTWVVNPPLTGRETFEFYCASCHGRDGTGNGPLASALKTVPADLTTLAARNGGQFPPDRVRALIAEGREDMVAHGSSDMPVWGPILRMLESPDRAVETRIENLVQYIESIQAE